MTRIPNPRNSRSNKAPVPFGAGVAGQAGVGQRVLSLITGMGGPMTITMSPQEAFGQLLNTKGNARDLYSQVIMQLLSDTGGSVFVSPKEALTLRPTLAIRTIDAHNLAWTSPDPESLLECYIDPDSADPVEVYPTARGLAVIEALTSGHDATY